MIEQSRRIRENNNNNNNNNNNYNNNNNNFRPISCLPLMWKLMTGVIAEVMYKHLEGILPEEQKGCRRRSRGTKDQLLIDKAILKDCKRRHTNLAMAWIDYRKAYDMVPHSWIGECLEMFGIAVNVRQFLLSSMKKWKTLLFVLCMVPLSLVLRRSKAGYECGGGT